MSDNAAPSVIWNPSPEYIAQTNIAKFADWVKERRGIDVSTYTAMWEWSTTDLDGFWSAIWEYFEIGKPGAYDEVLASAEMPGAKWFTGAHVNLAAYILSRGNDDDVAIVTVGESGDHAELTWRELRRQVAAFAATLRRLGVQKNDVVVGYLPNIGETLVAAFATVSMGALWSGVGQDYAPQAAIDRFAQLEPKLLVTADGHWFGGKQRDQRAAVKTLRAGLPTVQNVIGVSRLGLEPGVEDCTPYAEAVAADVPFEPADLPFDHPLWILFSSGTTGLPKGMVHPHGGVVVEQAKLLGLNWDLKRTDRFMWYTSPSWVMWNCLIGGLSAGGSVVCYDGSPMAPDAASLWKVVADNKVTIFGTSPGFLAASQDQGVHPSADFDLSALRIVGSTGSPLPDRAYRYVASEVGDIPLFSMSGGTDVAGSFTNGAPNVPVWAGELSVRGLGIAMESWSDDGQPQLNKVGELVITKPMPSMPLKFWNDPDGKKYHAAYFDNFPGVWRHGDWITVTDRGSVVVHGRSDSTLNRNGVRMGSADIYAAIESMDEVAESLVIGAEEADGGYWMPLFVVLQDGYELTDELVATMKQRIREQASPRHVPDEIHAVPGIPHTRTGKKLEVPIKRLIQGTAYEEVVNPDVVDVPELMDNFRAIASTRYAEVQTRL
ncbi:acetoacetyl-CoA synthetase [Antricoccus suffuscus]|uniref:Acetoacetyl-CoA synthetase n=1 Tax=Antricoccus suffuscus TaxID=1629062 RepID=A0A2T1A1Q7_9ACTN|nr:acetoacetate--CoA ligase [Antricoccus suffuscus]PRZ42539.1 acetoacetyl-CoA synthetase [Antricoccus suffuscus]